MTLEAIRSIDSYLNLLRKHVGYTVKDNVTETENLRTVSKAYDALPLVLW